MRSWTSASSMSRPSYMRVSTAAALISSTRRSCVGDSDSGAWPESSMIRFFIRSVCWRPSVMAKTAPESSMIQRIWPAEEEP